MNTKLNESSENKIKRKPHGNRNKTIHKLIVEPIVNTLYEIKSSLPFRRNPRVHPGSMSFKKNPLRKKGGKTRKNRKTKRKQ